MKKTFTASLSILYEMLDFIRVEAEKAGFDSSSISQIELAAEEALVNIVNYGYPEEAGEINISCTFSHSIPGGFKIIIQDNGIPYNPLATLRQEEAQHKVEKGKPGGYGVLFILKIMDEVRYQREANFNILTLVKYL